MSAWTWVLVGLCAAGALLALGSTIPVLLAVFRVRAKMQDMKRRPVFLALESLRVQGAHLSKTAADARPLVARAQTAATTIQLSLAESGAIESRLALERAGAGLHDLYDDLR